MTLPGLMSPKLRNVSATEGNVDDILPNSHFSTLLEPWTRMESESKRQLGILTGEWILYCAL